jgi:hypothetical protein
LQALKLKNRKRRGGGFNQKMRKEAVDVLLDCIVWMSVVVIFKIKIYGKIKLYLKDNQLL